jgi:hypothetical protein
MFDSPISRCEVVREMVLTDQTQAECATEHGCPPDRICPLRGCFYEVSGVAAPAGRPAQSVRWTLAPAERAWP